MKASMDNLQFDDAIAGGGSAACVLAYRLSARRVLLIEAAQRQLQVGKYLARSYGQGREFD